MINIRVLAVLLLVLGCFGVAAEAQRKTPVRRPAAVKKAPVTRSVIPSLDVRVGKEKVSNQLANVNRFIEVLGPIAQGIENLDNEARIRKISKTSLDQNEANKQKVVQAIRNLRAGLVSLETEFRTKPDLKKYLESIQGISDLSAQAEDSALAGKFVASKDPLRAVAKRLSDTLAVMP